MSTVTQLNVYLASHRAKSYISLFVYILMLVAVVFTYVYVYANVQYYFSLMIFVCLMLYVLSATILQKRLQRYINEFLAIENAKYAPLGLNLTYGYNACNYGIFFNFGMTTTVYASTPLYTNTSTGGIYYTTGNPGPQYV